MMMSSSSCRVKVAVRIRPHLNRCDGTDSTATTTAIEAIHPSAPPTLKVLRTDHHNQRDRQFEFDHVFDPSSSQEQVYEQLGAPLLKEALNGYNCCLFSYGSTGSGKSYSIFFAPPSSSSTANQENNFSASQNNNNNDSSMQSQLQSQQQSNTIFNGGDHPDISYPSNSSSSSTSEAGLFPRLVDDLFVQLQQRMANYSSNNNNSENSQQQSADSSQQQQQLLVKITFSAVEIYMEKVRDLLAPRPRANAAGNNNTTSNYSSNSFEPESLDLFEDPKTKRVTVKGLSVHNVLSSERVKELLLVALSNRQTAETKMNEVSSRSHSLMQLTVTQISDKKDLESVITIVDLAGSERQTKSETSGQTLEEGKKINLSLLTLGRALHSLSQQNQNPTIITPASVVSFRESKLTRLLSESLGGNSKTWMLATIAASATHVQESLSTLEYATHARAIANKNVHVNASVSKEEIDSLRSQLRRLEEASHCVKKTIVRIENEETIKEARRLKNAVDSMDALAIVLHSRFQSLRISQIDKNLVSNVIRKSLQQTHSLSGKTLSFIGAVTRRKISEIEIDSLDYINVTLKLDEKIAKSLLVLFSAENAGNILQVTAEVTVQRLTATRYSTHIQDFALSISSKLLSNHQYDDDERGRDGVRFVRKFKSIRGKVFLFQDDESFFPMKSLSVQSANNVLKAKFFE